jgi:hypothetical protein
MKGLLRIFELTKNEQRVVLIIVLVLIAVAFVRYERRIHRATVRAPTTLDAKTSPSPVQAEDEQ